MAVLDPSGFQFSVVIHTSEGGRIPLWMREQSAEGQDPAVGAGTGIENLDLPIVESVDLRIAQGLNLSMTINLAATYDLGLRILDSPLLRIGNQVEMQAGYPKLNRFLPTATGMTQVPSVRITADEGLTASLNVQGGAFASFRGASSRVFQNKTYREIIQDNCDRFQWQADLPDSRGSDDPLDQQRPTISQANRADWYFLQWIVRSANCDGAVVPSQQSPGQTIFRVRRRREVLAARPRFVFVMRGRVDFDVYFPLLSFESQMQGVWAPRSASAVLTGDINPDDRSETTAEATPQTTAVPSTSEVVVAPGSVRIEQTQVQIFPDAGNGAEGTGEFLTVSARDPLTPAQVVESHRTESAARAAIQATVTALAIPEILPGEIIQIENMGVFNGNYEVRELSHKLAAGSWDMEMQVLNNASTTSLLAQELGVRATIVNTETADTPISDSGSGIAASEVEAVDGEG